ncbi:hypothetical protein HN011_012384 [Eciton burchellii]|nr:hypothetical protein HN011_012384 [Eciton burchellii]
MARQHRGNVGSSNIRRRQIDDIVFQLRLSLRCHSRTNPPCSVSENLRLRRSYFSAIRIIFQNPSERPYVLCRSLLKGIISNSLPGGATIQVGLPTFPRARKLIIAWSFLTCIYEESYACSRDRINAVLVPDNIESQNTDKLMRPIDAAFRSHPDRSDSFGPLGKLILFSYNAEATPERRNNRLKTLDECRRDVVADECFLRTQGQGTSRKVLPRAGAKGKGSPEKYKNTSVRENVCEVNEMCFRDRPTSVHPSRLASYG